jgi:hypothetical protein
VFTTKITAPSVVGGGGLTLDGSDDVAGEVTVSAAGVLSAAAITSTTTGTFPNGIYTGGAAPESYWQIISNSTGSNTSNGALVGVGGNARTNTAGTQQWFRIAPTYNQASGTAANTDLLIDRTSTSVGSGAQYFIEAKDDTVTKFAVDSAGAVSAANLTATETLGTELVTNGSFTGGTSPWTVTSGWAYGTDNVSHSSNGTTNLQTSVGTLTVNKTYKATFTLSSFTAGSVYVQLGPQASNRVYTAGTYSFYFYQNATSGALIVFVPSDASRFTVDDVSVREVTDSTTMTNLLKVSGGIQLTHNGSLHKTRRAL